MSDAVRVIMSNTDEIQNWRISYVSKDEFDRLEEARAGELWVVTEVEYPKGSGCYDTYHGPA